MAKSLEKRTSADVNQQSEKREKKESPREVIHSEINRMLRKARKSNEGAAGIIIKMDLKSFSSRMQEALGQLGIEVTADTAAKLLKVYAPGAAQHEFSMQYEAYEALEKSDNNSDDAAKIPKPLFHSVIEVDDDVADNLRAQQIVFNETNSVEVLLMEWVPGEDILTQMYKKVIEFFPKHTALPKNPNDFQQLRYAVSLMLELELPNPNALDAQQQEYYESVTYRRNVEKVHKFLNSKGLLINPKVPQQIERSVTRLHQGKVWHNDLHERNVVVSGDMYNSASDAEIESFILDFGTATLAPQEKVLNDLDLVQNLNKANPQEISLKDKLLTAQDEILASRKFNDTFAMIKIAAKKSPQNAMEACYSMFFDPDGFQTILSLNKLVENKIVSTEDVKKKINDILAREDDKRFSRRKNLRQYIETL